MHNIVFKANEYEAFIDYNDIMIQAFGIGCSLCGATQISFVLQNHPITIGSLMKKYGISLTDKQVEELTEQPIKQWQNFEDENFNQNKATFLCEDCWNEMN